MSTIIFKVGSAASGRDYATIQAAWAAIPDDVVASGNSYVLELYKDSLFDLGNAGITLTGKATDASHTITIRPAAGHGYRDNPNALTNPYAYNPANGVAISSTAQFTTAVAILNSYVSMIGLQIRGGVYSTTVQHQGDYITTDGCIIETPGDSRSMNIDNTTFSKVLNTLILAKGKDGPAVYQGVGANMLVENCTIAHPSDSPRSANAFQGYGNGGKVRNTVVLNYNVFSDANYDTENNAFTGTINGNGLSDLPYAAQFIGTTAAAPDFRLAENSVLINAGAAPSPGNNNAAVGFRQQGAASDIGAWEHPDAVQAPSATVTDITVAGMTVTVTIAVTGSPTSGSATLTHTAAPYNDSAVDRGPVAVAINGSTATATFTGMRVGQYGLTLDVGNAAYPSVSASNAGSYTINVVDGAVTSLVQDPMDGEILRIHGTYTGGATSATLVIPAATSNPNGAVDTAGTVTLNNGTFTASADLAPGSYGAGVLRFVSPNGTSLAQPGTGPVSVVGIYGTPQADQGAPDTVAPVMSGSIAFSAITASGFTMAWTAAMDDTGVARYELSLNGAAFTGIGSAVSKAVTGLFAETAYTVALRAVDFGGNVSNAITASTTTLAAAPVVTPNTVSILLDNADMTQAANLSGLRWAWFDQATPNLFAAPTDHGTGETTDGNGQLTIPLPNSVLQKGGVGWLIVTDSTGNPELFHNAFSGPVAVG